MMAMKLKLLLKAHYKKVASILLVLLSMLVYQDCRNLKSTESDVETTPDAEEIQETPENPNTTLAKTPTTNNEEAVVALTAPSNTEPETPSTTEPGTPSTSESATATSPTPMSQTPGKDADSPSAAVPSKTTAPPPKPPVTGADYTNIKADTDDMFSRYKTFGIFDHTPAQAQEGYYSYTVWSAAATMTRITGDTSYTDKAINGINHYIDTGTMQSNGYPTWRSESADDGPYYTNNYHHEWRAGAGIAEVVLEMQRGGYEGTAGTKLKFTNFLRKDVWEKWTPGHTNVASNGYWVSNLGDSGTWFVGRLALIAMALDQAQARGDIPATGKYRQYLEDPDQKFSQFFKTYNEGWANGTKAIPWWVDRYDSTKPKADTEHAGDMIHSVMRAYQLGYNPGGQMPLMMTNLEKHINELWFVDADGWTPNTDGTGTQNDYPLAGAQGMGLTAIISPEIRDRWVDFYLNGDPAFNNQERRALQMSAGILAALSGETL